MESSTPKNTAIQAYLTPLLQCGYLSICDDYAQAAYSAFLEDMAALQNGAKWSDLGLSERRNTQRPMYYSMDMASPDRSAGSFSITPESIAVIPIKGVIRSMDSASTRGADSIAQDVLMADANPNIRAIVLEINSGGGESAGGNKLHSVVKGVGKPVIAMVDMAGSAALNIAVAANEIWATHNAAEIGGIGTYVMFSKSMMEQMASDLTFIYSEGSDRKNEAMRALMNGDTSLIQKEVNASGERFRQTVRENRELRGNIDDTLSGAMFDAVTARRRGLIDGIGTFQMIMERAAMLGRRHKKK